MVNFSFPPGDPMLSRPVRLEWAGWSTDTFELQRNGWSVSAHQDMQSLTMLIAVQHPQYAAEGVTRITSDWMWDRHSRWEAEAMDHMRHPIGVRLGRKVDVHLERWPEFLAVDATPQLRSFEIRTLSDLAHFAPRQSLEAPFVLPAPDVDQLLQIILEKQQKAKTDYFRDLVRKEGAMLPAHTMSAQIISLKAA